MSRASWKRRTVAALPRKKQPRFGDHHHCPVCQTCFLNGTTIHQCDPNMLPDIFQVFMADQTPKNNRNSKPRTQGVPLGFQIDKM